MEMCSAPDCVNPAPRDHLCMGHLSIRSADAHLGFGTRMDFEARHMVADTPRAAAAAATLSGRGVGKSGGGPPVTTPAPSAPSAPSATPAPTRRTTPRKAKRSKVPCRRCGEPDIGRRGAYLAAPNDATGAPVQKWDLCRSCFETIRVFIEAANVSLTPEEEAKAAAARAAAPLVVGGGCPICHGTGPMDGKCPACLDGVPAVVADLGEHGGSHLREMSCDRCDDNKIPFGQKMYRVRVPYQDKEYEELWCGPCATIHSSGTLDGYAVPDDSDYIPKSRRPILDTKVPGTPWDDIMKSDPIGDARRLAAGMRHGGPVGGPPAGRKISPGPSTGSLHTAGLAVDVTMGGPPGYAVKSGFRTRDDREALLAAREAHRAR